MIVRLSVSDNDFGDLLLGYIKNYFENVLLDIEPDTSTTEEEQGKQAVIYMKEHKKLKDIMRKTESEQLSEENKQWLTERTKMSFAMYISKKPEDTRTYLNNKLEVSFPQYFEDKWENGEACYWFQNSNVSLLQ